MNAQKEIIIELILLKLKKLIMKKIYASFEHQGQQLEDENELAEEGIKGNTFSEALVIQRSLLSPPASSDDWLRNIFQTRCTAGGKLCNLIIDSGSSENLVSQEMVDKLKTKRHPLLESGNQFLIYTE